MERNESNTVRYIISMVNEDENFRDRFDDLKEVLINLKFQIQYVSNDSIIGKGPDNSILFIKRLYEQLNSFPFELQDELTIYYPSISRNNMNLVPDIDHAVLKHKNDLNIVHPFRRYV